MDAESTILAVASAPGRSSRGIVRVSGPSAWGLIAGRCALLPEVRSMVAARLRLDEGEVPCQVFVARGPASYTGEDAIELQLPGNPALLARVIDTLVRDAAQRGVAARRADAGEFTARAYFNGRLSLTEAEGVAATIAARSDAELRAARLLVDGTLGRFAEARADELATALALVEAGIDFTDEEDVVAIAPADLRRRLITLRDALGEHLDRSVGFEQLEAIPWVVLAGPANAGKSTLFNALLGRERAVVNDGPGTTRDVLVEPLRIDGPDGPAEIMLADIAGAELALDAGDATGVVGDPGVLGPLMQRAAAEARARAELILWCVAVNPGSPSVERPRPGGETLIVRTKGDLANEAVSGERHVSAHTGAGLDELRAAIGSMLSARLVSLAADATALHPRHDAALRTALAHVTAVIEAVTPPRSRLAAPELIASDLRAALDALAELAGSMTPDDVLGRVFATFCIGK